MAMCFFAACQQVDIAEPVEPADSEKVMINIAVDGSESNEAETKSVVAIGDSGIKNVSLFIFCNGSFSEAIYGTVTSGTLNMTSTKGYASNSRIDVFGLANVGNVTSNATLCSDAIASYGYTLASTVGINTNGFPMVGKVENAPVGTPFTMHLVRLTAKYGFKFVKKLNHGQFQITSLRLLNSPKVVYPFEERSKVSSTSQIFPNTGTLMDLATSNNLTALNRGNAVPFYVLENCQGTLLPGNTDPWAKIPSNIGSPYKDLCTYIEVKGTYTDDSGGLTATHTYRMYLGQDNVTNFDVIRNTSFTYTLALSDDGFLNANWKAERTVNSDTRSLTFDKSTYEVKSGSNCDVSLTYNPDYFDCNFSLSQNLRNAGVSFDTNYMTLKQSKELTADVTGTLTATSWDGKITASCNVVAKKHQDDVIIEIKPASKTMMMTSPYTSYDVELTTNGIKKSLSYDEFEITSSNVNVVSVEYQEDCELLAKGPGTATITVSDAETGSVTNSVIITVQEDRKIELSANQSSYNAKVAFPITIRPNFDATSNNTKITLGSEDGDLKFSTYSSGGFVQTLSGISVGKNQTKTIYGIYDANTVGAPDINAYVPKTTVEKSITITIKKSPFLTLTIADYEDWGYDTDEPFGFGIKKYVNGKYEFVALSEKHDDTPPDDFYMFDGDCDNYITATAEQWQNLLNYLCNDDCDCFIDGEADGFYIGMVGGPVSYATSCENWDVFDIIQNMIDTEQDATMNWLDGTPPPTPPTTKPTKTFYLWPSNAYYKDYEDQEDNVGYVKFSTNNYYWKHTIIIEPSWSVDWDWANEPWDFGPGSNSILQISSTPYGTQKWDDENNGIEVKIDVDENHRGIIGYMPEGMWISGVRGLSSSQYTIEYTYVSMTGNSGTRRTARKVTIEESDCIYEYIIQF